MIERTKGEFEQGDEPKERPHTRLHSRNRCVSIHGNCSAGSVSSRREGERTARYRLHQKMNLSCLLISRCPCQ
jgi:hypothetical protein